jgi:hypothetical protein
MSCFNKTHKAQTGWKEVYLNEYDSKKHKINSGRKGRKDTRFNEAVDKQYPDNVTSTAKYSLLSFVPMSLFYHFSKYTNLYFLIMTILMLTKYSPFTTSSVLMPILFITAVSMLREGLEDYSRHKSDK